MISFSKICIHGNCMDFFSGCRIIRPCQNDFGDVISDWEHSVEMLNCMDRMRREKIIEKMNGKMKKKYSKRNGKMNELERTVIY